MDDTTKGKLLEALEDLARNTEAGYPMTRVDARRQETMDAEARGVRLAADLVRAALVDDDGVKVPKP